MATATASPEAPAEGPAGRDPHWLIALYRSAVGKKYVMAITGIMGLGYVIAHLVGNLKIYLGAESINEYAHWLRESLLYPILPHNVMLWILRLGLIAALVLHLHAAYALTVMNRNARPTGYQSKRDFIAADFASRTMRWTGVIVLLFIVFHLLDLTWGQANPDFVAGDVFHNVSESFQRGAVVAFYVIAQLALAVHLYHGIWSLGQTMGLNNPRWNSTWRGGAIGLVAIITVGNISFPVLSFLDVFTTEGIL